jgi:hypothetical protein
VTHTSYQPRHPWPADCRTQHGGRGVVFGPTAEHDYTTAFFEAFPRDPVTFLRGEGATIAAAEDHAWAQWRQILACPGHALERRGYTNGAGFCRRCNLFVSRAFDPIPDPAAESRLIDRVFRGDPAAVAEVVTRATNATVREPGRGDGGVAASS